jgi:hypothetical protein
VLIVQVQLSYYYHPIKQLQTPPVPFKDKLDAILYVNSNCKDRSNRTRIMQDLQQLLQRSGSTIQLHSFGQCGRNVKDEDLMAFAEAGKIKYGRQYKFCVVSVGSTSSL